MLQPAAGMRLYAFGDVHGRFDLFDAARRFIAGDVEQAKPERPFGIFLGDIVDRGPASAAVVECLARQDFPIPFLVLRGNHEQMLLDALLEDGPLESWLRNGGVETLMSYDIALDECRDLGEAHSHHLYLEGGIALVAMAIVLAVGLFERRALRVGIAGGVPLGVAYGINGFTEIGQFAAGVALHLTELAVALAVFALWWRTRRHGRYTSTDPPEGGA